MRKKIATRKSAGQKHLALAQQLARHISAHHEISAGQRIGVAVSGGADSVALLRLLLELRSQLGIVLSVTHFNHQLRGRASATDEKFVAKLAAHHGLHFFVARESIAAKARTERANLEDTARRSRYAFFDRLVAEGRLDRIAVAHTADDQAETVLAHILRGTGLAGLGGIHPESGTIFRPLLHFRRADLRAYLRWLKQPWREDATNRDTTRTRARIRHKLIPLLAKQFQPVVVEHLCQLADLARADDCALNRSAEIVIMAMGKRNEAEFQIPRTEMLRNRPALASRMIRQIAKQLKPHAGQLSAVHVDAVLRLAQCPDSGKSLHLPGGVEVRRESDALVFRPANTRPSKLSDSFSYPVDLSSGRAELRLQEHSQVLHFRVIDWPPQGRETNPTGAVLDRDKLVEPLVLRSWLPGDSLQPLGHQKRHKLSRLLNESGISRWQKVGWPVLLCGAEIAWCRGLPVATQFAPGTSTRKGLAITEVSF